MLINMYYIMKSASFKIRALAHLIDILFITVFVTLPLEMYINASSITGSKAALLNSAAQLALLGLTVYFWMKLKGTPGKMLLKICVVNSNGLSLTMGQSVIRYFAYIVSFLPLGLGFIWALINKEGRCWHDIISDSYVIDHKELESFK